MLYNLYKKIKNPFRNIISDKFKIILNVIFYTVLNNLIIKKRKNILLYLGMHRGNGFDSLFIDYKKCYCFEANPKLVNFLKKKYKFCRNVEIIHAALTDSDSENITLNISNNEVSSSIGKLKKEWSDNTPQMFHLNEKITMVSKVKVPALNLNDFLKEKKIDFIDTYISDIQGIDLQILKTIKSYIHEKKIETIISETTKDEYGNIHEDLPDNSENGFIRLLSKNYEMVGKGIFEAGEMKEIPVFIWGNQFKELVWEFDTMWRMKK